MSDEGPETNGNHLTWDRESGLTPEGSSRFGAPVSSHPVSLNSCPSPSAPIRPVLTPVPDRVAAVRLIYVEFFPGARTSQKRDL